MSTVGKLAEVAKQGDRPSSDSPRSYRDKKRVALIIESSSVYGRELLSGIVRFRTTNLDWMVFLEQRDLTAGPPSWLESWRGDGIISRATNRTLAQAVASTGVPLVELTDRSVDLGFTYVWSNDGAIGQLAAEHLLERGFQQFAFCGFRSEAWSERREQAFGDAIASAGFKLQPAFHSVWYGSEARSWEQEQTELAEWLRQMPRPIGIMACNDVRGQHIIEACARAELMVPEEVAVIGVDNDRLLCQLCDPPLSSVIPNAELIGYRAAELLARQMDNDVVGPRQHLIDPMGVATRQSTDTVAIDDADVAAALSFIRDRACLGISVDDVTAHVGTSRSTLERKLRKFVNRSPQEEIRNVQLRRVRELLTNTDLPTDRIAIVCGFVHPEYLHVVFRREMKMTPGEFRRSAKT